MSKFPGSYESPNHSEIPIEKRLAKLPCQNCGRLVTVHLPFMGCVFCSDCARADSSWESNSEHFHQQWLGTKKAPAR